MAHPTARKWVITPVLNGIFVGLIHWNHWGYNPLTIRGMSHQVLYLIRILGLHQKNLSTYHWPSDRNLNWLEVCKRTYHKLGHMTCGDIPWKIGLKNGLIYGRYLQHQSVPGQHGHWTYGFLSMGDALVTSGHHVGFKSLSHGDQVTWMILGIPPRDLSKVQMLIWEIPWCFPADVCGFSDCFPAPCCSKNWIPLWITWKNWKPSWIPLDFLKTHI